MSLKHACTWVLVALFSPLALAEEDYLPSEALRGAELIKAWQLRLPLDKGQTLLDAYLVDDQLYLATNDGYVFAVHADTGAIRWLRRVTSEGFRLRRPCHAGDRVIFATPTTVLQLNRLSGEGASKLELRFPAGTGPVTDGARLFLGGLDSRLHALQVLDPVLGWQAVTNGPIMSTPVVYEASLFAASDDGSVYSCTPDKKTIRWQTTTFGSVTADLAVNEHGVYVANRDQSLYLLDPLFGEIRWRARFSGALYEAPVVTPDLAYQYCPDDGLVAVNTAVLGVTQRNRWTLPRGRTLLTIDQRYAYVLSRDETVLIVSLQDGDVAHTLPAPGLVLAVPSPARTALYLASPDGRLFCAWPRGTPLVTPSDLRGAITPPEAPTAETGEKLEPTTKPAKPEEGDLLTTSRKGRPLGGKSKVSKSFREGGAAEEGGKPKP
jgi:hypothetical protein